MKKINVLMQKYKWIGLSSVSVVVIGVIGLLFYQYAHPHKSLKEYKNDYYDIKYDKSWSLKKKEKNYLLLKNNQNAKVTIQTSKLEGEYQYTAVEDTIDSLLYDIEKQNPSYKLLAKEKKKVTKNEYEGYQALYETENKQVLLTVGKKGDTLVLFSYESSTSYFDILLDSVTNIVYHFSILDEPFQLDSTLKLDTSSINWSSNDFLTKNLKNTQKVEIASKNYQVIYEVPEAFQLSSLDSTMTMMNYQGLESGSLSLNVNIRNTNIYEYLNKEGSAGTLYNSFKKMRKDTKTYQNFEESLQKYDKEKEAYLYRSTYQTKVAEKTISYEEVYLVLTLDKNHILIMAFRGTDVKIPKELIEKVKITSIKNYANYIKSTKEGDTVVGELKQFRNYKKEQVEKISIKLPSSYEEIDKGSNVYKNRSYGTGYKEETARYEYNVAYGIVSSIESQVKTLNASYGTYQNYGSYQTLVDKGQKQFHDKAFSYYVGGYTNLGGVFFTSKDRIPYYVNKSVLFYPLESGQILMIEVTGNGLEISESVLHELTNFDIKIEDYKKE